MFAVSLAAGCASTGGAEERILSSWRGAQIDQVFRQWGLPQRQAQLGDGSALYEWNHSQSIALPGSTTGTVNVIGNIAYINAQTRPSTTISGECTRTLAAGVDGKVTEGNSRGSNCCVMAIAGYCASLLNPATK